MRPNDVTLESIGDPYDHLGTQWVHYRGPMRSPGDQMRSHVGSVISLLAKRGHLGTQRGYLGHNYAIWGLNQITQGPNDIFWGPHEVTGGPNEVKYGSFDVT